MWSITYNDYIAKSRREILQKLVESVWTIYISVIQVLIVSQK